ncbi:MAG: FAD-dependent oxidoreductase [Flavobacteriaceae bacterium]
MSFAGREIVVVGCGIGGLSAAVSALEAGARVTLLERAPVEERGGQTRYTEAYLRMKSETEVSDDFEEALATNGNGAIDPALVALTGREAADRPAIVKGLSMLDPDVIYTLASSAPDTIKWLKQYGVRFEALPTQFLTRSQPRLLPVGGGLALVEALFAEVERRGAEIRYECTATGLIQTDDGAVRGVRYRDPAGKVVQLPADAVVLACGGFQGNAEMSAQYLGPRASYLRPVARGGYFNKGDGIRMALGVGAAPCGDYGDYHAEPVDPRSGIAEPSVFIFSYGILVNSAGKRFADEAPMTVDACYERITREIYRQDNGIAYCILDARHMEIPNYRLGIRTDQPPFVGQSLAELADTLGIPGDTLTETIEAFNAACAANASKTFTPLELDGLSTKGLRPAKSNWAYPLDRAPYHAYPIISSNVFTFGGLKIDVNGQALDHDGRPVDGLYAAGEIIGSYYRNYTGGTSVLKGAVFGRRAGLHASGANQQS